MVADLHIGIRAADFIVHASNMDSGVGTSSGLGGKQVRKRKHRRAEAMLVSTAMTDALGKYLDLVSDEMKLTAGNVANIDTPGYRSLGIDFDAEFQQALAAGSGVLEAMAPFGEQGNGSIGSAKLKPKVKEVDGLTERPDGNNVSLDREGMQMADAQLKFKIGAAFLKRELAGISEAIHVDGK